MNSNHNHYLVKRAVAVFFIIMATLLIYQQITLAGITGSRAKNDLYVSESEGLEHSFTAYIYKTDVALSGLTGVDKINVTDDIVPIYDSGSEAFNQTYTTCSAVNKCKTYTVGTNFPDNKAAKAAAGVVYSPIRVAQIIQSAAAYALKNNVKIIHFTLSYKCKINNNDRTILLAFNVPVSGVLQNINAMDPSNAIKYATDVTGFLIVDEQPVWVRVLYISNTVDSSILKLKTGSQIKNMLAQHDILGRLLIQEMSMDGKPTKTLVDKQIKDNKYDCVENSGQTCNTQYAISKIIRDYESVIEKDTPLWVMADYVSDTTIALDQQNNEPIININVLEKKMVGKVKVAGGHSCVITSRVRYSDSGMMDDDGDSCSTYYSGIGYLCMESDSNAYVTIYSGERTRGKSGFIVDASSDNAKCHYNSLNSSVIYSYTRHNIFSNSMASVNLYSASGSNGYTLTVDGVTLISSGPVWTPVYQGTFSMGGGIFRDSQVITPLMSYGHLGNSRYSLNVRNGHVQLCVTRYCNYWFGGGKRGCGKVCTGWINLVPHYYVQSYSTKFHITYTLGGLLTRYMIPLPLTEKSKSPLDYLMNMVMYSKFYYNNADLNFPSGYDVTMNANAQSLNYLKQLVDGKTPQQISQIELLKYLIVDPFNTGKLIDVRDDTVNGLPEDKYVNADIPVKVIIIMGNSSEEVR